MAIGQKKRKSTQWRQMLTREFFFLLPGLSPTQPLVAPLPVDLALGTKGACLDVVTRGDAKESLPVPTGAALARAPSSSSSSGEPCRCRRRRRRRCCCYFACAFAAWLLLLLLKAAPPFDEEPFKKQF